MDDHGNFDDLGALEDFASDTIKYGDDDSDSDDDRCSYDEDLDLGKHGDPELMMAAPAAPESMDMLPEDRQNGDGQEHLETSLEDKTEKESPNIIKKKILPTLSLALFDDDNEDPDDDSDEPLPRPEDFLPPQSSNHYHHHHHRDSNPGRNELSFEQEEQLESFDSKLRRQQTTSSSSAGGAGVTSPSSFSSGSDDPELLNYLGDTTTPEDIDTPDPFRDSAMDDEEWDWESQPATTPPMLVEPIPEYTAAEEFEEDRSWRTVQTADGQFRIDMKVIEPYKKVLSHGGYYGDGFNAIVVFNACFLPDRARHDYHYVMDNLFLYVVSTLELLVVDDYMILFFHGGTPKTKMPGFRWLRRCYQMIDRRLRKNLKKLAIVHPTLWLRTVMIMTRPIISAKFAAKIQYIKSLQQLHDFIPTEFVYIPDEVKAYDATMNGTIASYSRQSQSTKA